MCVDFLNLAAVEHIIQGREAARSTKSARMINLLNQKTLQNLFLQAIVIHLLCT